MCGVRRDFFADSRRWWFSQAAPVHGQGYLYPSGALLHLSGHSAELVRAVCPGMAGVGRARQPRDGMEFRSRCSRSGREVSVRGTDVFSSPLVMVEGALLKPCRTFTGHAEPRPAQQRKCCGQRKIVAICKGRAVIT